MINALILQPYHKLNGTLFDVFEYYICMLENNVPVFLIIIGDKKFHKFFEIFEEKYNIDDIKWKDSIIYLDSKAQLLKYKFNKVLMFDYTTIAYCHDVLDYKNLYIITNKINYKRIENATYFTELWNVIYYDVKYKCKFLFDRYKEIKNSDNMLFVNVLGNIDIKKYTNKDYITKKDTHYKNFFSSFNEYLYITDGSIFDCHPRLFHECYFYNKKIEYINTSNNKDGAYYRYIDLMKNGLDDRHLNSSDEIIKLFLEERN